MRNITWREHCRPIIANVIKEHSGKSQKEIRKALKEAYPYGERAMHPYKIWCDEIKIQLGLKKKKIKGEINNPNQTCLL